MDIPRPPARVPCGLCDRRFEAELLTQDTNAETGRPRALLCHDCIKAVEQHPGRTKVIRYLLMWNLMHLREFGEESESPNPR